MNQKHNLRSLGSRWFNCHLCLFRIECRVVLLLDSHCIKDSGECNKDWITNNQYWSNWKKKLDSVGLWGRRKQEKPLGAKKRTQQQTQPTYGVDAAGFEPDIARRRVLLHYCANLVPRAFPFHFLREKPWGRGCYCATGPAPPNPLVIYQESFFPFMHMSKWFFPKKICFSFSFLPELLHLYKQRFLGGL